MSQSLPDPYIIKGSLPDRYPRGWFCIGADYEFTSVPQKLDYFGTSLVAYRGADSGQVHVLDAYCPHMGANLAGGDIVGDSVICPFHRWSWGQDGLCNNIPYANKIPNKARIKSWPVMEENELVYVWNDPDQGQPIPEQAIPREAEVYDENWTPWVIRRVPVASNCRELLDNMADKAHFVPVHGSEEISYFQNISEGHSYTQLMKGSSPAGEMDSKATYYGPGYMIHSMHVAMADGENMRFLSLVMNVPTVWTASNFWPASSTPFRQAWKGTSRPRSTTSIK